MSIKKVGGWIQHSQKVVFENPWIQITHEEVTRPNGSAGTYGVVNFKSNAIGVIAIDEDDNTYLVKQSRYPNNETTIEIPEGGGPLNETPLAAAQRELKEETGFTATNWQPLMELRTSNSVTNEKAFIFLATELTAGEQELEETEDIELIKTSVDNAIEMAMNGEIIDAMSIAALLKLAVLRNS